MTMQESIIPPLKFVIKFLKIKFYYIIGLITIEKFIR